MGRPQPWKGTRHGDNTPTNNLSSDSGPGNGPVSDLHPLPAVFLAGIAGAVKLLPCFSTSSLGTLYRSSIADLPSGRRTLRISSQDSQRLLRLRFGSPPWSTDSGE